MVDVEVVKSLKVATVRSSLGGSCCCCCKSDRGLVKSASRTDISLVKRFGLFSFRSSSCGFSPCLAPQQLYYGPPACGIVKKALETLDTVR